MNSLINGQRSILNKHGIEASVSTTIFQYTNKRADPRNNVLSVRESDTDSEDEKMEEWMTFSMQI